MDKWPHDKWREEEQDQRHQQKHRANTEEPRKSSKHDSSRYQKDYFEDRNKPAGYQGNSYSMERHSRYNGKALIPRFAATAKCNSMQVRSTMNSIEEQQCLNAVEDTEQSDYQENHETVHVGAQQFCPRDENPHPGSNSQTFKDIYSKPVDVKVTSGNRFSQTSGTETELFSARSSSEICTNEINHSRNLDMNHIHSCHESSLPVILRYSIPTNESSQFSENCNKQYYDQSNLNIRDSTRNICTYEERLNSQSVNMSSEPAGTNFLNYSAPYERCKFSILKLPDLLYYNASLMQDQALFDFSIAIKSKILEIIGKFPFPEKEELNVLCEITDGDQSEKNQQIITTRICHIVRKIIEKIPHILNIQETAPPTQILVYPNVPNLHGMPNISSSNYNFKIVKNSEVVLTSGANYNLMSDYKIPQNDQCVTSKANLNSFDNTCSNDYKDGYKIQHFNANDAQNTSRVRTPSISEENTTVVEEFSKNLCPSPVSSSQCKPVHTSVNNKKENYFASFELDQLLTFNTDAMHEDVVFEFAFSMKEKILEKIDWFKGLYKEKLIFLCELTDGTQREENQKLINERMCDLIFDYKDEIVQNSKNKTSGKSKNVHTISHDENEVLHEEKQNIDEQLRTTHPMTSHEEVVHEQVQNFREEQSRRLHYDDEVKHQHRQNYSGELRNAHPRISHEVEHEHKQYSLNKQAKNTQTRTLIGEDMHGHWQTVSDGQFKNTHPTILNDKVVYEHRQNISVGQSRSAYQRMSHDELRQRTSDEHLRGTYRQSISDEQSRNAHEIVHEHRPISDEQPRNIHPSVLKDKVIHDHGQNISDRQSRNTHSSDEVAHDNRQNISDGQSRNAHSRVSYDAAHEHEQKISNEQLQNTYPRRSREVVYEEKQNISDKQPKSAHPRTSGEMLHEHKQKFLDVQPRKILTRRLYCDDEVKDEFRQNFSDVQSRNAYQRKSHYKEETAHERKQNFLDEQSKNVYQRRSHYSEETMHEHKQNFLDGQSKSVHQGKSHYSEETVHERKQNFLDGQSGNLHHRKSHYSEETVNERKQNFVDGQSRNARSRRS